MKDSLSIPAPYLKKLEKWKSAMKRDLTSFSDPFDSKHSTHKKYSFSVISCQRLRQVGTQGTSPPQQMGKKCCRKIMVFRKALVFATSFAKIAKNQFSYWIFVKRFKYLAKFPNNLCFTSKRATGYCSTMLFSMNFFESSLAVANRPRTPYEADPLTSSSRTEILASTLHSNSSLKLSEKIICHLRLILYKYNITHNNLIQSKLVISKGWKYTWNNIITSHPKL